MDERSVCLSQQYVACRLNLKQDSFDSKGLEAIVWYIEMR